jgi:hypothetical protein
LRDWTEDSNDRKHGHECVGRTGVKSEIAKEKVLKVVESVRRCDKASYTVATVTVVLARSSRRAAFASALPVIR